MLRTLAKTNLLDQYPEFIRVDRLLEPADILEEITCPLSFFQVWALA